MIHWDDYLDEGEIARLKEMYRQHFPLGALIMALQPFRAMLPGRRDRIRLPLGDRAKDYGDLPDPLTSCIGYREFFDALKDYSLPILAEFQSFRDIAFERKDLAERT